MRQIPDHPEIRHAERTGYPSWVKPGEDFYKSYCWLCGCEVDESKPHALHHGRVTCLDCMMGDDEYIDEEEEG